METGQVVDVLEVRQGSVVGYLEAGHCFGENFDTKYDQNVTACELHWNKENRVPDSFAQSKMSCFAAGELCDLCFLEKDSVQELSLEHPELHQSIEDFIAKRKREEGSRYDLINPPPLDKFISTALCLCVFFSMFAGRYSTNSTQWPMGN